MLKTKDDAEDVNEVDVIALLLNLAVALLLAFMAATTLWHRGPVRAAPAHVRALPTATAPSPRAAAHPVDVGRLFAGTISSYSFEKPDDTPR